MNSFTFTFTYLPDESESETALMEIAIIMDDNSLLSFEKVLFIAKILRNLQSKLDISDAL